ncbi:MAG: hypothetical protein U5J63_07835 [Fodinibius sp.]|nr:hypothetical protein [Fodinibius sp.]
MRYVAEEGVERSAEAIIEFCRQSATVLAISKSRCLWRSDTGYLDRKYQRRKVMHDSNSGSNVVVLEG